VAFREFVAVEESMPVEQCVAILQSHKRTLSPIIAAIDHWAFVRRRASLKSKNNWQKLIAISRRLDSDSVLNQFRSAWENDGVLESRQLLRELAEQVDVGHQHPSSLSFMFTVLRDAGYHSEAERLLVRSHLQYPDDFWITFNLGYTAPNNQDGVNCYYFVLPSLRPESGFSYNLVGFNLLEQGHVERAIPWLRRSIELAPDFVAPHLNLVRALVAQRKFDEATRARAEAIRVCQAGILHNPNSSGLHNDLGVLLKEQGQLDDAIACYRKSVELDPNLASAHRNLAFALARQGQLEEALTSLRTALKLVPNESTAAAQISSTIGQWESQVPLNKRFRAILKGDDQPQDNSERLAFAALAYQQHRHVVAARFFFEALTSDPTLADDRQAQHRYNAACAAALAGCDQPMDSPALEETTQARWRAQAREWLQLELAACAKLLESAKVMERAHISKMLHHWQADPDLAGVRDPERLTKLPQGEQRSFQQLWKSVAELIEQAESVAKLP
jgi:tetratricopeptide (TPR) repeat protein